MVLPSKAVDDPCCRGYIGDPRSHLDDMTLSGYALLAQTTEDPNRLTASAQRLRDTSRERLRVVA